MSTVTFNVQLTEKLEEQPLAIPSALFEQIEVDFSEDDRDATYTMNSDIADTFEAILEASPAVHSFTIQVK